jgi:hypothetical protein
MIFKSLKKQIAMKRKNVFLIVICLMGLNVAAQPVITHNGNAPQIDDIYASSGDFGSFDPGPAGAGQNWDYSDITPTFSSLVTAVTPGSTPFAGEFPEANIAFHYTGDVESYSYAEVNNSEMLNDGVGFNPAGTNEYVIHYTDAVKLMNYPFSFSDSYTDTYFAAYTIVEDMMTHEWGNITVTADAWGSVTTPAGTFGNTLRVKREMVYTDSVWMTGTFLYANTYTQTHYEWFTATSHYPVMSISITEDGTSATYLTDAVGISETEPFSSQISLYPNPATDRLNIELPEGITGNTEIYIFNLKGQRLLQLEKTGNHKFLANISDLISGVYVLKIKNSSKNFTTSRFIKR